MARAQKHPRRRPARLTPPVSAHDGRYDRRRRKRDPKPPPDYSADVAARKNYVFPALAIVGFDVLPNQYNRRYISDEYKSNMSSIRRNFAT
ncbi:MAG: hypothetical protein IPP88_18945 [Betaproteobacteria bacterium]|nr:hypothetical protein [Betaproteobacteria bacterium]